MSPAKYEEYSNCAKPWNVLVRVHCTSTLYEYTVRVHTLYEYNQYIVQYEYTVRLHTLYEYIVQYEYTVRVHCTSTYIVRVHCTSTLYEYIVRVHSTSTYIVRVHCTSTLHENKFTSTLYEYIVQVHCTSTLYSNILDVMFSHFKAVSPAPYSFCKNQFVCLSKENFQRCACHH